MEKRREIKELMNNIDLQYKSDAILIETIAAYELGNGSIIKSAGLFDSLGLGSVGSAIKSFVSSHVKEDAPGGYVGSVLALMVPAVLFRAHPLISAIYLIASQFGFDIQSIVSKIVAAIKPKLEAGEQINPDEFNEIGKSAVGSQVKSGAPNDLFEPLRKLSNSDLAKLSAKQTDPLDAFRALLGGSTGEAGNLPKTPLLFGGDGTLIQKIFGQLFSRPKTASRGMWLIGGFVIWILKTVLVGAGLMYGAEAIAGALGHKKAPDAVKEAPKAAPAQSETATPAQPEADAAKEEKPHSSQSSSSSEMWVVPMVGGSVESMLVAWAFDLYPELEQYPLAQEVIESSSTFKTISALLKSDPKKMGTSSLVMPDRFSSRKQVVDLFIDDVKNQLSKNFSPKDLK
jgi:hypothetical protein